MMKHVAVGLSCASMGMAVWAQPPIDAVVVSVSGRSVYLSLGERAGVRAGAHVVFVLTSGERIEGTIIDVSSSSARAEVAEGSAVPALEDRAEVEAVAPEADAPSVPAIQPDGKSESKPVPQHAPWTRREPGRGAEQPLLAPAFGTRPEDRPSSVRGRVFSVFRHTRDFENNSDYSYARFGTSLEMKNPFKDGGRFLFDAETDLRVSDTFGENKSELQGRVQRFSYAWGLDQHSPYRLELGRFCSQTLPEIGTIDGAEASVRFENGWSIGGGVGSYPTPIEDDGWGDDLGFHVFADYQSESDTEWVQGTLGFQQTWHRGEVDRSVFIGRVNARPTRDLTLFGSVMVDLYGSEDTSKDLFADVTQLITQASYQFNSQTGVSGSLIRTTWPEIKRGDFHLLPKELLSDGYIDRVSGSVWRKLGTNFRLSARAHAWQDQDRDGFGGELSADWYGAGSGGSSMYGSVYLEDSAYTDGVGARLQARHDFGEVRLSAGYDAFLYSTSTALGGDDSFIRHTLRGDVSWSIGRWYWDLETTYDFGDREEALTVGMYAQYRF